MTVKWDDDMDAVLRAMRAEGRGHHTIGAVIGVDGSTVKRRIVKLGLPVWSKGGGYRPRGVRPRVHDTMEKQSSKKGV